MSIRSFVTPGAFNALDDMGQPKIVLEVVAQRIIDAAKRGERDPVRLVETALPWLTRDKALGVSWFGGAVRGGTDWHLSRKSSGEAQSFR